LFGDGAAGLFLLGFVGLALHLLLLLPQVFRALRQCPLLHRNLFAQIFQIRNGSGQRRLAGLEFALQLGVLRVGDRRTQLSPQHENASGGAD
jgi:hypothetical protein